MNKFNFNRFGKVVVRDFHNTYSLFGMSMLIIMMIPAFVWLMGLAVNDSVVEVWNRRNFISMAVYLTAAISSMKIYGSCNLVGKGNYFAMLPASLCEKFTSMVLYCFVVCPLVVFVGSVAVDTILTILPFGPYKEFLWQVPDWMKTIGDIGYVFSTGFSGYVLIAFEIFSVASLFMLANTIFKKNKFIKTILWLMLIIFALIIIIVPIMNNINWLNDWNWLVKIAEWLGIKSQETFMHFIYWSRLLGNAVVTSIFSFIAYRRLKKMQY
ncbi:MAG: hypothetical protein IJK99_01950 [Bacteroidales bacterium]|nr:hypothetical protein [Bacteroidales bacterium]